METKSITTAAELIRMALDPNVSIRATGEMLYQAKEALSDAADDAVNAANPAEILRTYREARRAGGVLAKCETDGSPTAGRTQESLAGYSVVFSDAAAEAMIYRVLAPAELRDTVNKMFAARD